MEGNTLIILAILIVLVSIWMSSRKSSVKGLPGPWTNRLPIVGSLFVMSSKPFLELTELSKKYGPVYWLRIGSVDVAVTTDYEIMKEAFAKDAFMHRPPDLPFEHDRVTVETGAVTGMAWREQKNFAINMFKDFGVGKTELEGHLREEVLELLERISANEGKPIKHASFLYPSVSNNMSNLIFGNRRKHEDSERKRLDYLVREIARLNGLANWQLFFPWLKAITGILNLGQNGRRLRLIDELRKFCRKEIQEHEATLDPNNIRDYVDGYLLEIKKKSNDPNTSFRKEVLEDLARTLFGAGSETVKVPVDWMLLVCAAFPDVQKRIHAEIDQVIGAERFPAWSDRLNMPFTEAAIAELMRWRTIVPVYLMRCTHEDVEVKGYDIPKDMRMLYIQWAVDHDPRLWGKDVNEYKPERFLSQDGEKVLKPEYHRPFSTGKRPCPGKQLAKVEVFIYIVAILQKFEVQPPPGKKIDFEGQNGVNLYPNSQEICFKPRRAAL